jgi:hypothetical protein
MGCDIHMCVELYDEDYSQPPKKPGGFDYPKRWFNVIDHDGAYGTRNYTLFSVLAGLRCPDDFPCIVAERGLPADADPKTLAVLKERGQHTASWLTLREIYDYTWPAAKESGVVDALNAQRIIELGEPTFWADTAYGPALPLFHLVEWEEMVRLLKQHPFEPSAIANKNRPNLNPGAEDTPNVFRGVFTKAHWNSSIRERCQDFLAWIDSLKLTRLNRHHPEHVRLVFNFDN